MSDKNDYKAALTQEQLESISFANSIRMLALSKYERALPPDYSEQYAKWLDSLAVSMRQFEEGAYGLLYELVDDTIALCKERDVLFEMIVKIFRTVQGEAHEQLVPLMQEVIGKVERHEFFTEKNKYTDGPKIA